MIGNGDGGSKPSHSYYQLDSNIDNNGREAILSVKRGWILLSFNAIAWITIISALSLILSQMMVLLFLKLTCK